MTVTPQRRLSAGVEIQSDGRVHARVWSPRYKSIDIVRDDDRARSWRLANDSDLDLRPMPEPLLAPPFDSHWATVWSSESPHYGGDGTPPLRVHSEMHVPGESAELLRSEPGPIHDNGKQDDDQ